MTKTPRPADSEEDAALGQRRKDREHAVLNRLLATPPDHKRNVKSDAKSEKARKAPEDKNLVLLGDRRRFGNFNA